MYPPACLKYSLIIGGFVEEMAKKYEFWRKKL
jgi:hypothetical protein